MTGETAPGPMAVSLAECKAQLRLERDDEDGTIAGFIRTAMALCEAFTGQWLMIREGRQRLCGDGGWQRITACPVVGFDSVESAGVALASDTYETDIDAAGNGWVRLLADVEAPVALFRAGLGDDWNAVPEPLRQGLIRLVVHLFTHRDAADAGPPPAAVTAMWRPWRRMRLN